MAAHLITTLKDLKEAVSELTNHSRLSCDTETYGKSGIGGLFPFHGSRSFSIIFATATDEYYFGFNTAQINPKHKIELQPIFDDEKRIIFFVNAIFDATILHFDGIKIKSRIVDGPSIARIEYNKHGKNKWDKESFLSLEYLANYYEVKQKNDAVKQYIKEHQLYDEQKCKFTGKVIPLYNLVPLDLMFEYGCDDARSTFDLCTNIIKCINFKDEKYDNDKKMIDVAKNEIALTSVLVDIKIGGMRVWTDYIEKAIVHEQKISTALHKEIENLTGGINLNSGKQIAEYLTTRGVEVPRKAVTETAIKRMDNWLIKADLAKKAGKEKQFNEAIKKAQDYQKGNPSTDKKTLAALMTKYPNLDFLSKITSAKEADKKIGTYYSKFLLLKDDNDIIHCGLNQEVAKTGRFSSTNPNLQNLSRTYTNIDSDEFVVRKSFIADEGYRLFFADYSQQEMIVMLDQAGEMSVIEKLLSGEHSCFYLATSAVLKQSLGVGISRAIAKAMALGLAYGQGKVLLAKNLGKTVEEAAKFKAEFFNILQKVLKLKTRLEYQIRNYGRMHNAFGRVIYLDYDENYKGLNAYIQSTSADITKIAMVNIDKELKAAKVKSKLSLSVHDEVVINMWIGEEKQVLPIIEKAMVEAYSHKHIALKVDFEYSPINKYGVSSWGEKQKWVTEKN